MAWTVFFLTHMQAPHQPPDAAHTDTQAAFCLQSVGQFRQGQVGLLLQPALHLLAGCCIDQYRAAGVFSIRVKCAAEAMQPQQLFDKGQANAKEFFYLGVRSGAALTGLHDLATRISGICSSH